MTAFAPGVALSVLTGLGNGYDTSCSGERPLLVGGGVGIPPLYGLARRLRAEGKAVSAALGFHSAADVFLADELRALGVNVRMGCGFGACMGCSCKTKYGTKRICKDGPVLRKGEIVW